MPDYDIEGAFRAIENELLDSMIRNLRHHRAEETKEGFEWTSWQTEQLNALNKYKSNNSKIFKKRFAEINSKIEEGIRESKKLGSMDEEIVILDAIKKGFKATKQSNTMQAQFFKVNERKLDALIKATKNDMRKAETAMLRMANDQYRKVIFNAQVYANTGAGTYEQAVDMATKDFLSRGINCVEYKNGARVNIASYAAMAIRTANTRAYLQGEGEKRQEWGISTVIVNKRGNPCLKCLKWVGKVLIDDVWSGGKTSDGPYPLMSTAMAQGLYHPNCKDGHTTFFPGISEEPKPLTREDIDKSVEVTRGEQKLQYAQRQADRFQRLADYSLNEENKRKYSLKVDEWNKKVLDLDTESELGKLKKKLRQDDRVKKDYYEVIKNKFAHGKDDAKRIFNKYVPDDSVADHMYEGVAEYKNGKIKMHYGADMNNPRGAGVTWFHEHGHMIDELAGDASNNKDFLHALRRDFLDNTFKKSYIEMEKEISQDMRRQSAVSDLFNGLSGDKIKGIAIHPLRNDGSSYWTEETIRQEAFAHMFECQFDELRYAEMNKYFPNALSEFEKIMRGL